MLLKPHQIEGKITLTPRERRLKLDELCQKQEMRCARCKILMTRETGLLNSASLGHDKPQPMGCKKRDNLDNLNKALCFKCNFIQGSKRF